MNKQEFLEGLNNLEDDETIDSFVLLTVGRVHEDAPLSVNESINVEGSLGDMCFFRFLLRRLCDKVDLKLDNAIDDNKEVIKDE